MAVPGHGTARRRAEVFGDGEESLLSRRRTLKRAPAVSQRLAEWRVACRFELELLPESSPSGETVPAHGDCDCRTEISPAFAVGVASCCDLIRMKHSSGSSPPEPSHKNR